MTSRDRHGVVKVWLVESGEYEQTDIDLAATTLAEAVRQIQAARLDATWDAPREWTTDALVDVDAPGTDMVILRCERQTATGAYSEHFRLFTVDLFQPAPSVQHG